MTMTSKTTDAMTSRQTLMSRQTLTPRQTSMSRRQHHSTLTSFLVVSTAFLLILFLDVQLVCAGYSRSYQPVDSQPSPADPQPGLHPALAPPLPPLPPGGVKVRSCEPITIDICQSIGYNVTGMPNLVGHETQQDADQQLRTFTPLIQYGCSTRLTFLLCSTYVPMCTEKLRDPIGPCRPICESVRSSCGPILNQFGFPWPMALNCSKFPVANEGSDMCMVGPDSEETPSPSASLGVGSTESPSGRGTLKSCEDLYPVGSHVLSNKTQSCALDCAKDGAFKKSERKFAEVWMSVWSGLCFVATAFTVITFLLDSARYPYPTRAIIIIAFCYNICSVAYVIRLLAGWEAVACRPTATDPPSSHYVYTQSGANPVDNKQGGGGGTIPPHVLVSNSLGSTDCTVVFLLVYYFSTASSIWWLIVVLNWFLVLACGWTTDAVARYSTAYHALSWSVPAVLTVVALVLMAVDADELTGMCLVGYHSSRNLLIFVIIPLTVVLIVGVLLLIGGLIGLRRRSRSSTSAEESKASPAGVTLVDEDSSATTAAVEKRGAAQAAHKAGGSQLPASRRVGLFVLFHLSALVIFLACSCYEYHTRELWYSAISSARVTPSTAALGVKLVASLVVGVSAPVWLRGGARATLQVWTKFYSRLRCRSCCWLQDSGHKGAAAANCGGQGLLKSYNLIPAQPIRFIQPPPPGIFVGASGGVRGGGGGRLEYNGMRPSLVKTSDSHHTALTSFDSDVVGPVVSWTSAQPPPPPPPSAIVTRQHRHVHNHVHLDDDDRGQSYVTGGQSWRQVTSRDDAHHVGVTPASVGVRQVSAGNSAVATGHGFVRLNSCQQTNTTAM